MNSISLGYLIITCIGLISTLLILSSLNPISRLILQIMVFLMSSFQFLILDYYFLGLTYIIVYVGAIAILFLFVIMLIQTHYVPSQTTSNIRITSINDISGIKNQGEFTWNDLLILDHITPVKEHKIIESPIFSIKNTQLVSKNNNQGLQIILGLVLIFGINILFTADNLSTGPMIYTYFYPSWSTLLYSLTDIQSLGYTLFLGYPIAIVILGLILWMVLIGILCISTN